MRPGPALGAWRCYTFQPPQKRPDPLPKRIGEILIERGKLESPNLDRALKLQEGETRDKIGVILLRLGMVSGRDLADALAEQLDLPLAQASDFPELPLLEERLSAKFLRDAQAVPLREDDEEVALAIADPADSYVLSAVQMASGKRVRPLLAEGCFEALGDTKGGPRRVKTSCKCLPGALRSRPWKSVLGRGAIAASNHLRSGPSSA